MKRFEKSVFVLISLFSVQVFAQTAPKPPTMPNIPYAPGSFYTPGSNGFYTGTRALPPYVPAQKNRVLTDSQKSQIQKDSEGFFGKTSEDSKSRVLTDSQKSQIQKDSEGLIGKNGNEILTAKDLSLLESRGVLGKLSGIVESSKFQSDSDSETLKLILQRLNEIKAETSKNQKSADSENSGKKTQILRFNADGADWSKAVCDVHFSDEETDGTFLLTGDLRYSLGGQAKTETFYLLFRSSGENGGAYTVSAESSGADENTIAARLSKKSNLSANRTGNLVSMRVNDSDLKLDLLISMKSLGK